MAGVLSIVQVPIKLAFIVAVLCLPAISAWGECQCGQPMDECDFYFEGYKDQSPVIDIGSGTGDQVSLSERQVYSLNLGSYVGARRIFLEP
jgi:hypothetical protein